MTQLWSIAALVLACAALAPAVWLGCSGGAGRRLVGLEIGGAVLVLLLMLVCQAEGASSTLIVPLVLVVLSFAGVLVFTRLLGGRS